MRVYQTRDECTFEGLYVVSLKLTFFAYFENGTCIIYNYDSIDDGVTYNWVNKVCLYFSYRSHRFNDP